jgi:hypothetical protein
VRGSIGADSKAWRCDTREVKTLAAPTKSFRAGPLRSGVELRKDGRGRNISKRILFCGGSAQSQGNRDHARRLDLSPVRHAWDSALNRTYAEYYARALQRRSYARDARSFLEAKTLGFGQALFDALEFCMEGVEWESVYQNNSDDQKGPRRM